MMVVDFPCLLQGGDVGGARKGSRGEGGVISEWCTMKPASTHWLLGGGGVAKQADTSAFVNSLFYNNISLVVCRLAPLQVAATLFFLVLLCATITITSRAGLPCDVERSGFLFKGKHRAMTLSGIDNDQAHDGSYPALFHLKGHP